MSEKGSHAGVVNGSGTHPLSSLTVLSMGWGVQTWTLAAMMALDEHPRADFLVFADTHHEGQGTYEFAHQWTPWLGEHGLTVVTVEAGGCEGGYCMT